MELFTSFRVKGWSFPGTNWSYCGPEPSEDGLLD